MVDVSVQVTRDRDVAEAHQLADQAAERGSIRLPQLTDVDLCVFSDSFATLADLDVWQRWCDLPGDERDALAEQARDFLGYRRLLRPLPADGNGDAAFAIQPKLGFILAARQRPAVLGVCSVPGQLRVGDLRMFVIADEMRLDPLVVLERTTARGLGAFGRIRQFVLATPEAAGGITADWVHESIWSDLDSAGLPRCVDFYRHFEGAPLTAERFAVMPAEDQLSLTHYQGGAVVAVDVLVDRLAFAERVAQSLRWIRRDS